MVKGFNEAWCIFASKDCLISMEEQYKIIVAIRFSVKHISYGAWLICQASGSLPCPGV